MNQPIGLQLIQSPCPLQLRRCEDTLHAGPCATRELAVGQRMEVIGPSRGLDVHIKCPATREMGECAEEEEDILLAVAW